ncbi:helix-turn-helix transcriptional regulator [Staphylococcus hyicus]|uniref:helix-turn-helix domain-containing protein n=1 Tax=Staphylococcus hyicus TaxID=1284 RepID=UPI0027387696|nr:helix-turn-helix transcriptional regulator [Staphylococcus hyicus]MDP4462100.1 helix-turn-helix transcriptional regulator [Staphylococcus hyicus]
MKLGKKIKKLRFSKNMTQEELAEELYVSVQTVNKWENDKCLPDVDNLLKIANYFQISVDEFLGNDIKKNRSFFNIFRFLKNLKKVM